MNANVTTAPVIKTLGVDELPAPFVDASTQGTTYYGWAPIGIDEGENGWRLMKETVTNSITKREYAECSMDFKFSWTDRATYNYSR